MTRTIIKEKDETVLLLREQGKTFRQIGKIMNLHFSTVYERYLRAVGVKNGVQKLSTDSSGQQ